MTGARKRPAARSKVDASPASIAAALGAPPTPSDRPVFLDEMVDRLPKDPTGRPRFSRKWARLHVAPEAKRYAGRLLYWLERDVLTWERAWFGAEARRRP